MSGYGEIPPPPGSPGPPGPTGPPPGPPGGSYAQPEPPFDPPSGPPPGHGPEKAGRGLIAALVAGVIALVAVAAVFVVLLVTGDDDDKDSDADKARDKTTSEGTESDDPISEEAQVEKVIIEALTTWSEAESGDDPTACDGIDELLYSPEGEDIVEACRSEIDTQDGTLEGITVISIELDGDEGTAKVAFETTEDGDTSSGDREFPVIKDDGKWKVVFEN